MKIVAVVVLLFCLYCVVQLLGKRAAYQGTHGEIQIGCWTITLLAGFGWSLWILDVIHF
jgi:hypothetical protein